MKRILSFLLILVLVIPLAGFQSSCPGRKQDAQQAARSAEEQFAAYTDRVSEYIGRGLSLTDFLVTGKTIKPENGTVIVEVLDRVNAANKSLVTGAQQFVRVEDGKRILRFTESDRLELEKLANATEAAARDALNSPALLRIDPTARSQLKALITPAKIAATRLVSLIKRAKNITVVNPAAIEIELSYERSIEMGSLSCVRLTTI